MVRGHIMKDKLILIIRDSLAQNIGKSCNLAENIADDIFHSDFVLVPKDEIQKVIGDKNGKVN